MDTICFSYLFIAYLHFGYIDKVESKKLRILDGTCEEGAPNEFFVDFVPVSFKDIFHDQDSMKSLKELLHNDDMVRLSGYGFISPTFSYIECTDRSRYLLSNNVTTDLDIAQLHTFSSGSLYHCALICFTEKPFSSKFGYANNVCYCVDDNNASLVVHDKFCETDYNTDNVNYNISTFSTSSFSNDTKVDNYDEYYQLCQYALKTHTGGIQIVNGFCNLPVDGIVCLVDKGEQPSECSGISEDGLFQQCVIHEIPENVLHAKLLCDKYSGNLATDLNYQDLFNIFDRYQQDKSYFLNGYRELFISNTYHYKYDCVSAILQADLLFVLTENCYKSRRTVCEQVDYDYVFYIVTFTPLILPLGYLMFSLRAWIFLSHKPRTGNTNIDDITVQRQTDRDSISSQTSAVCAPDRIINMENDSVSFHRQPDTISALNNTSDDNTPVRFDGSFISGSTNDTFSVPGRMPGRMDQNSVPGRTK